MHQFMAYVQENMTVMYYPKVLHSMENLETHHELRSGGKPPAGQRQLWTLSA